MAVVGYRASDVHKLKQADLANHLKSDDESAVRRCAECFQDKPGVVSMHPLHAFELCAYDLSGGGVPQAVVSQNTTVVFGLGALVAAGAAVLVPPFGVGVAVVVAAGAAVVAAGPPLIFIVLVLWLAGIYTLAASSQREAAPREAAVELCCPWAACVA